MPVSQDSCFREDLNIMSSVLASLEEIFYSIVIATLYRGSHPEVFLRKGVRKICGKFTGEHPCRSVISINLQSNFIENAFRHGCSPVNLQHIFRTPFLKNTSRWLLLPVLKIRHTYSTMMEFGTFIPELKKIQQI